MAGAEVVGDDGDVAVRDCAERFGDVVRGVVVEEAMPEVGVAASGDEDAHFGFSVGDGGGDEFRGSSWDATVGAFDDVEGQPRETEVAPGGGEVFGFDRVEIEVHGPEIVGGERARRIGWRGRRQRRVGRRGR